MQRYFVLYVLEVFYKYFLVNYAAANVYFFK